MTDWLADPQIFAVLLGVTLLEMLGLMAFRIITKRGLPIADIMFHLAAGAFLTVACWLALSGALRALVLACLAASGVAHVIDLSRRWRNKGLS